MREALLIGFCKYVANSNENFFPRVSTLSKLLFALENLKKKKKEPSSNETYRALCFIGSFRVIRLIERKKKNKKVKKKKEIKCEI